MISIPTKYLRKLGDYDIIIDGISLKAKVVDSIKLLDELIPGYFDGQDILGLDLKLFTKDIYDSTKKIQMLVISSDSRCLIILDNILQCFGIPESLKKFLVDPNICFVRPSITMPLPLERQHGVACCELACRVLKKSGIKESDLRVIASEVGIPYKDNHFALNRVTVRVNVGSYGPTTYTTMIRVDSTFDKDFPTQEQVKMVCYDAFKCYQIAFKLLSSLN